MENFWLSLLYIQAAVELDHCSKEKLIYLSAMVTIASLEESYFRYKNGDLLK